MNRGEDWGPCPGAAYSDQGIVEGPMADLPELPDTVQRKPALQWSTVLDQYHMTGEHLHWHEKQWNRTRRIQAQMDPPKSSCPGPNSPSSRAFDQLGITQSVVVAERRFNDLAREYFQAWYSSTTGYETFVEWLKVLKQQVLAELRSVWEGGSEVVLAWFQRACSPAVKKELDSLIKQKTRQARDAELKRLERDYRDAQSRLNRESTKQATSPDKCASDRREEQAPAECMAMSYPKNFPERLKRPIDAAIANAEIQFQEAREKWPFDMDHEIYKYVLRVFSAFGRQSCRAFEDGHWNGEAVRTEMDRFLAALIQQVYSEKHPHPDRFAFNKCFDCATRTIRQSDEWKTIQSEIKRIADLSIADETDDQRE